MWRRRRRHLASSAAAAGDALALGGGLAAGDRDARPLPAAARSAEDVDVSAGRGDGALDVAEGKASDGDAGGGGAGGGAVLVVLLNDDTVLGDVREGNAGVSDARDGAGGAGDRLNTDTVVGVDNLGVGDGDGLDGVVGTATNGADRETVATRAGTAGEGDVGTGVDSQAVVLVLDVGARDVDTGGGADIESIGVVASSRVTGGVVEGDVVDAQVGGAVDGESLDGGVQDVQALDVGALEAVGVEELGLGLAAVAALAVPPAGALAVNGVSGGTVDLDVAAGEGDEGSLPLLVAEGGLALEGDLFRSWSVKVPRSGSVAAGFLRTKCRTYGGAGLEAGHVEGGTGGDGNAVQDNAGAAGLALDGGGGIGEGAAGAGLNLGNRGGDGGGRQGAENEKRGNHFGRVGCFWWLLESDLIHSIRIGK